MPDYDVVVVGSGAAGLSAAVSAADAGAEVLVVEADTQVGGSSRLSGGHFYAAGTEQQSARGVDDSADAMFEHYMTLNQWMVEPSVVRRYCDASAPTLEWLQTFGVRFDAQSLYPSGVGSTPRGHPPEGAGAEVVQRLDAARAKRGVDLALGARVDRLLSDVDGRVVGVEIDGERASAGAVVLACGGFGANDALVAEHYPSASASGDWRWYIGSPHAQGDGLLLGQSVGAALDGHDRGLLLATPGFSRDLEVLLPPWIVLVNSRGRRFVNETAPYTVLAGLMEKQGGPIYAVFDEAARAGARRSPTSQAYWVDEVLQTKADEGVIGRASRLEDLAEALGIHAGGLSGTIEAYNVDVRAGQDRRFFKRVDQGVQAIEAAPFYGVELRANVICWTGAGLRIDADTHVLSESERVIPGLYAAGETVGSLHGDRYVGGGGSFGPCIVFGKLAGEQAARYARAQNQVPG